MGIMILNIVFRVGRGYYDLEYSALVTILKNKTMTKAVIDI